MATENPILSAPQEQVSSAEDMQKSTSPEVDLTTEDAALAAQNAELDLDEATAEEEEHSDQALDDSLESKSKEELVEIFATLLQNESVQSLRRSVESIKIAFYKLHRADVDSLRRAFIEDGGKEEEFAAPVDAAEVRLKDLFKIYRKERDEYLASLESQKEENLKLKLAVIEELKELINSDETINHTFTRFRELQQRWKDIGLVPLQNVKDLWETYNLHIENFYNFIKINKELRDLDLKKNLAIKTELCEEAEALCTETSIVEAFRKLQKLHEQWHETGPVANEFKDALWERFRSASSRINKLHQEHFETLKSEQIANLELKTKLCIEAEELLSEMLSARKDWNKASDKLLELQKVWKSIGFAPKRDNNKIYERFRNACDRFFEAKREFYSSAKSEMDHNLEIKTELCEAAESLQTSEDWKAATDSLLELQAQWKKVGAVPRRYSDQIWKRFRAACDTFFARKSEHFAGRDNEQESNLAAKRALLEEMRASNIKEGGFEAIKAFQRRWSEIGFVPIKQKDAIQKEYKEVVDVMFTTLRGSERDRSMNRFKEKVSSMKGSGDRRIKSEREKLYNKVRQVESDIALLENNIGFFANSKGAESMIADVKAKISRAKDEMQELIEKIKLIDQQEA
ncbi:MAG: DUF349 domain-containing protein [Rikenellaceae bacterium]